MAPVREEDSRRFWMSPSPPQHLLTLELEVRSGNSPELRPQPPSYPRAETLRGHSAYVHLCVTTSHLLWTLVRPGYSRGRPRAALDTPDSPTAQASQPGDRRQRMLAHLSSHLHTGLPEGPGVCTGAALGSLQQSFVCFCSVCQRSRASQMSLITGSP